MNMFDLDQMCDISNLYDRWIAASRNLFLNGSRCTKAHPKLTAFRVPRI